MKKQEIVVHTAKLTNNCPECFTMNGLELTFSQSFFETRFYTKIDMNLKESINCKKCNSTIYPVNWTTDIERVFEYNKKLVKLPKKKVALKKLTYQIIGLFFIACLILTFLLIR